MPGASLGTLAAGGEEEETCTAIGGMRQPVADGAGPLPFRGFESGASGS